MSGANEIMVTQNQVAVKDSETEIIQRRAMGLLKEAECRVEKERYEAYLGYVKKFAKKKLQKTEGEAEMLSADEIKAIDFLMVPRAKRTMKIWGLANLVYVSGIAALAVLSGEPAALLFLIFLIANIPFALIADGGDTVAIDLDFLRKRRVALEYLKKKEAKEAKSKTEENL